MESTEREFFRTIREAIFSNPFGERRIALDRMAAGMTKGASVEELLARLVEKVGGMVAGVESRPSQPLSSEEVELLNYGKLFHTFHLFCDDYDAHIQEQVKKGDECIPITFGRDILSRLDEQGFGAEDSKRYLALFFQMRRAFYFIRMIAGESKCVMDLRRALWNNVFTGDILLYDRYLQGRMEDFSTMILGETGTGKGMAAGAIGRSGFIPYNARKNRFTESFAKAFISINLSQYPDQLIESELFGHKKGAFTGAVEAHLGVFSRCSPCGAIFLDEIGDVEVPIQIKLLQVLQARFFSPVGSHRREKFQGRVIAATNKDLNKLREEGAFRDDFYYRLCSDLIEIPPLRTRIGQNPEELRVLLGVVLQRIVGGHAGELVDPIHEQIVLQQPENYGWPGNIRELEQCVRRMLLSKKYDWKQTGVDNSNELVRAVNEGRYTASQLLSRYCRLLYEQNGTYEGVARIMDLDRRTVKKYVQSAEEL
ncbi:sigma-54 dependent transcriptional regulator [Desulfopila sp. IMCC35008]|uniref:sigma-54-dependent transcriptional regulator n=1 Tax=Desulfopila sp. IMCC35008 TaxID=2653858 RepID=UPI00197A7815|nr:sigma 54-interacting transcriptional regulator [Desulfopila sp. IMCC35008]